MVYTIPMKMYRHDIETRIDDEPRIPPERSIRHIEPSETRVRMSRRQPSRPPMYEEEPREKKRGGIWAAAVVSVLVLGGVVALLFLPETTVTVVPRAQTVPFDASAPFTAFPEGTATGTIEYTVLEQTFEDFALVPASGVEFVEQQAKGTITVFNAYSDAPVRLIKNTRFETPDGKIYRVANSIEVPGKKGTTPGTIDVSVSADQVGPSYNVGPFEKLTLPGLRSTPEMYANVYARSSAPFSGGFSGERPAVPPATLESTRAEIRNRLSEKVKTIQAPEGSLAFPALASLTFEEIPPTQESGNVRVGERLRVRLPVFKTATFAQAVGESVSASAEGNTIAITFSDSASASVTKPLSAESLGTAPLEFSLSGMAQLVWQVDATGLAAALAGKDESAFQAIVGAFPSVEEARARLVPFWKSSFPKDPADIHIVTEAPPKPF